jgi:glycosyltransferase involved in cell wall biosynthesis
MKILIASTFVPFIEGGGTFIVDWLDAKFREFGYQSDVLKIPFNSHPPTVVQQMLALRLMTISDSVDRLITIRTPSYIISHPNKIVWFIHHYRPAYDLMGTPFGMPQTAENIKTREAIIRADNRYLPEAKKIFTNSNVVSGRLKRFNAIDSEVLYPPLMDAEKYHAKEYGDYIFYPSRIVSGKRQQDAIESMKYVKSGVKLVIAGHSERREWLSHLEALVRDNGLSDKVTIIGRWISQEEKIDLFAKALGAIYIPFDEDSYGYVSLEAYHSKKPVITCTDSGGTLEVVEDGKTGYVVSPEPQAIAEAMDRLYFNKTGAQQMGSNGLDKIISMGINWENTIQRLVQ